MMCSDRLVDYHQCLILVYLIFLFIDFKDLALNTSKEITNEIFHFIDAMQRISSGNWTGY